MKDIDLAKQLLEEKGLALVIVKDGKVIFESIDRGIKPMYIAVNELKEELKGSSVADRVIGRAAAMLCVYADVKEVYARLISESAIKIFVNNIVFTYDKSTSYIKNRDQTDMCPVEKLSQSVEDGSELLAKISHFLSNIRG